MAEKILEVLMGATQIFNSAAQPTNAFSPQMWHHVRGNKKVFNGTRGIYCQEAFVWPNTDFLTFCAKFSLKSQHVMQAYCTQSKASEGIFLISRKLDRNNHGLIIYVSYVGPYTTGHIKQHA